LFFVRRSTPLEYQRPSPQAYPAKNGSNFSFKNNKMSVPIARWVEFMW